MQARLINSGVTIDTDPSDGYYSGDYLVIYNPDESDNGSSVGVSFGGLIETEISVSSVDASAFAHGSEYDQLQPHIHVVPDSDSRQRAMLWAL